MKLGRILTEVGTSYNTTTQGFGAFAPTPKPDQLAAPERQRHQGRPWQAPPGSKNWSGENARLKRRLQACGAMLEIHLRRGCPPSLTLPPPLLPPPPLRSFGRTGRSFGRTGRSFGRTGRRFGGAEDVICHAAQEINRSSKDRLGVCTRC